MSDERDKLATDGADARFSATPNELKTPRTARGRKTMRAILDAAAVEFGTNGFSDTSIVSITSRANVALGSFYTYFDSKEEVFRALVQDLSEQVKINVAQKMPPWNNAFEREGAALNGFLQFARQNKEIYRIIDEAEFVDNDSYRAHYEATAARIMSRLNEGAETGELANNLSEAHAWAIMGMNVFLGLRYGVWSEDKSTDELAAIASQILSRGIASDDTEK